ncbi:MAG: type II toxin-antitoxin system Phd/YefM family antitoxin [Candidatus Scalindua sp.]
MKRIIDVTTARRQFGTLLDEVFYKKDVIIIERKGKPLAQIIPFEDTNSQDAQSPLFPGQKELLAELHSLPAISIDKDPTTILRNIRKQKRVQANIKYGK